MHQFYHDAPTTFEPDCLIGDHQALQQVVESPDRLFPESGGEGFPVLFDAQLREPRSCLGLRGLAKRVYFRNDGQSCFIDGKCKRLELFFPDMERMDFADAGILVALADDQHGLRLVAHLRSDMSAHVVVPFVQMKHTVDVQVVSRRPFHHPVDDFHRFTGIIDVEHQVANAVDDDQSVAFLLAQRIVDDLDTHRRRIFTQAEKIEILRIGRRGQPGQPQYTLQYRAAMETALFRIDVQNTLFAFGQMCTVVQYLFPRQ